MTTPQQEPTVGIYLPSNVKAGPQKLAAITASDLANRGHDVEILAERLPYTFHFFDLRFAPLHWLREVWPVLRSSIQDPSFVFSELIEDDAPGQVTHRWVWRRPSKRTLERFDALIVGSVAQLIQIQGRFPADRTVFQVHHPEERGHGHDERFREVRAAHDGPTIAISPWTAEQIEDHMEDVKVVPNVVSPTIAQAPSTPTPRARERDILVHLARGPTRASERGLALAEAIRERRPETTFTVWNRGARTRLDGAPVVEDATEGDLVELFHRHKLFLYPSKLEGFGLPPVEALSCGTVPILEPGVGAADLYARHLETAVHLDPDALDRTAETVAQLLEEPDRLATIQEGGVKAVQQFDPEGYGHRLLEAAGILEGDQHQADTQSKESTP